MHHRALSQCCAVLTGAALIGVCGGCAQFGMPRRTEVWQVATNACFAHYRHTWADAVFHSPTSSVSVAIVIPATVVPDDLPAGEQRESEASAVTQTDERNAQQQERSDETAMAVDSRAMSQQSNRFDGDAESTAAEKAMAASADATSLSTSDARSSAEAGEAMSTHTAGQATNRVIIAAAPEDADGTDPSSAPHEAIVVAESSARFGEIAKSVKARTVSGYSLSMAESAVVKTEAKPAVQTTEALFPDMSITKVSRAPKVLAGRGARFTIRIENTGPLALRDIVVEDPDVAHLTLVGLRYPIHELVLPFLRTAEPMGPHTFRIRRVLAPGKTATFRLLYMTDAPPVPEGSDDAPPAKASWRTRLNFGGSWATP